MLLPALREGGGGRWGQYITPKRQYIHLHVTADSNLNIHCHENLYHIWRLLHPCPFPVHHLSTGLYHACQHQCSGKLGLKLGNQPHVKCGLQQKHILTNLTLVHMITLWKWVQQKLGRMAKVYPLILSRKCRQGTLILQCIKTIKFLQNITSV
jgi:hypothetical protein